ncbi:HD domain-containing phosphohydrolase [Methylobacterium sp. BTF04]|uniref:HD-GYP domain-containing protein n=1 Tax=Methylobacterium sp. BTF04 TaxID=2708300 RepID=UPI001FED3AD7|nr:HD domain-containing phosphohydrolase [Methylobacterium sp. BTF04]
MATEAGDSLIAIVAAATPLHLVSALQPLDCAIRLFDRVQAALGALGDQPVDVILIDDDDCADPGATRLIAALRAQGEHARTPIVLIAAGDAGAVRRAAVGAGASDVMGQPLDPLDLRTRLHTLIELSTVRRFAERQAQLVALSVERAMVESAAREREIIRRLMLAAQFRDDQAGDHLTRVAGCAIAIAEGLGLSKDEANDIALASTMHDIGKISIPDTILRKPGALSAEERQEMQEHALRGYHMLNDSPSHLLQLASDIALTHHERWDGNGYPQGLKGTEIPLSGRIIAVADVFDALISERVYKTAWPPEKARAYLEDNVGSHFDPDCVAAFLSRWSDIVLLVREHRPKTKAA